MNLAAEHAARCPMCRAMHCDGIHCHCCCDKPFAVTTITASCTGGIPTDRSTGAPLALDYVPVVCAALERALPRPYLRTDVEERALGLVPAPPTEPPRSA